MKYSTDKALIDLIKESARGDTDAFKRLYDASSPYLYALAMKMLQDKALAEDVLQDTFVKVWHRAGDYHADRGSVITWLATIMRYRAIDILRSRREVSLDVGSVAVSTAIGSVDRFTAVSDDIDDGPTPLSSAVAAEGSQQLQQCMERLSRSQMQSVLLAFFHGMTHQELSDCLVLPLGTVKSRLRRSLSRLKECLADLGYFNEIFS